jgi:hypothetical protein
MTLGGAAAGAGVGGLSSLGVDKKRRHTLRNMLTGALAGGAIGGGTALARSNMSTVGGNDAGGSSPGWWGSKLDLDPSKLDDKTVEGIRGMDDQSILGAAGGLFSGYPKEHPILAAIGAGDIMSSASGAIDSAKNKNKLPGLQLDVLRKGLTTDGANPKWTKLLKKLNKSPSTVQEMLVNARKGTTATVGKNNPVNFKPEELASIYTQGGGSSRGGINSILKMIDKRTPSNLGTGFEAPMTQMDRLHLAMNPKSPSSQYAKLLDYLYNDSKPSMRNKAYNMLQSTNRGISSGKNPFGTSMAAKIGPRAALYGGVPLLQYLASKNDAGNVRARELVKRLSSK